jgi:hypothetical protein
MALWHVSVRGSVLRARKSGLRCPVTVLGIVHARAGKFPFQCLSVGNAASEEFRPGRDRNRWFYLLGKQAPQFGVMPAQVVAAAVAMPSDTRSQPPNLGHQACPVKSLKVRIEVLAHLPILAG